MAHYRKHAFVRARHRDRDRGARIFVAAVALLVLVIVGAIMTGEPLEPVYRDMAAQPPVARTETGTSLLLAQAPATNALPNAAEAARDSGERDRDLARTRERPLRE